MIVIIIIDLISFSIFTRRVKTLSAFPDKYKKIFNPVVLFVVVVVVVVGVCFVFFCSNNKTKWHNSASVHL